ncbi:MAG: cytochrome c maturation protein CcmE [Alphaproteobacteria bacterium]|nr:cytochrome c maturation protein CcmE [Alphaproteobacteria bacterium]
MSPKKRRRLYFAVAVVVAAGGAAWLILSALKDNVIFFRSPSEVAALHVEPGVTFRIGGLVATGSVAHGSGAEVRFTVTDNKDRVPVVFRGVLPALFREGQGVVATGALDASGTFQATDIMAKHDEKYMPPEVVQALKKSGEWQKGAQ